MGNSRLIKIIFPLDIKSLTIKERVCSILFYTVPLLLLAMFTCINLNDFRWISLWILYCILFSPWFYYQLAYEKLEPKYKIISDIRFGTTYEFLSKLMVMCVPGVIITIIAASYLLNHLDLGIIVSLAFIVPSLALYFRSDVFNDESCIEGEEILFGYIPTWYGLLSLAIGIYGYFNAVGFNNSTITIILFAVTLIFQILSVMPDKFNKILSIEIRQKKGSALLILSLVIVFFIIYSIITGSSLVNLNNLDLSSESIIRKAITWGIAIILAILFAHKIRCMNKE